MHRKVIAILLGLSGAASAHEMTPTYPKMIPSYVTGVSVTNMLLFNRRDDVEYYEVGVFTEDWQSIPFATQERIIHLNLSQRKNFKIYINDRDLNRATYICTISKLKKDGMQTSGISSKICSKIK